MRFEYYTPNIESVPKLSVDGTVPNSIHFSHWEGNNTPAELKADTSTEIALNLVASEDSAKFTNGIELVTNNHFDTDGVLSVWTVLNGTRALKYRELLISAAAAGDFSEYISKEGVCLSLAIQGCEQASPNDDSGSPLARFLAGHEVTEDAEAYKLVLPEIERLLTNLENYDSLFHDGWKKIAQSIASFESDKSRVAETNDGKLSIVTLAPDVFNGSTFSPTKHAAPFTAISKFAHGQLFLIAIPAGNNEWFYRIDYPYYSWAETVVRPRIARKDLRAALARLNEEGNLPETWQVNDQEMTSAAKYLNGAGELVPSKLTPGRVAELLVSYL